MDVIEQGPRGVRGVRDMYAARGHVPDQPGIHGAEGQLAPFGPFPGAFHVIEHPADFGAGEVGVEDQACPGADKVGVSGFPQPVAHTCGAAVLPYDGVMYRLAGAAVPDDGRFPLIRDADGGYVGGRQVRFRQHVGGHACLGRPDFLRVVFDPAGLREDLPEFALRDAPDGAAMVEKNGARTGCALIEGEDVSWIGHGRGLYICVCIETLCGEGGIRTHDTGSPYTPLAGERLQPLGHLSVALAGRIPAHASFAFHDPC